MKVLYKRPSALQDTYFKYCGGCGHAIINKLIAEIIDEKKCLEDTVMVWPIGCSVYADQYFRTDSICALHGRAPALATGLKRAEPDKLIIVYQGDGDMVSEGMSEIIHAAIRGEKFSVIFVNNAIYGMTGGQMAPTTLEGQTTTTTPYGRKKEVEGAPVNMAELIQKKITRGRLWVATQYYDDEGNWVKKNELFVKDYQKLNHWIKKHVPYQEIWDGEYLVKEYINDELKKLQEEGYVLAI